MAAAVVDLVGPYNPEDITPEMRQAVKDRIVVREEDGIIVWREIPKAALCTTNIMMEHFAEVTKDVKTYKLLVDLNGTSIPNAPLRERYKQFFRAEYEKGRFEALAYVTGQNFIINAAARLVAASIGVKPFTIHKTVADALEALQAQKS